MNIIGQKYVHVIVVLILPTFAKRDAFAKSVANAGESCIFSRRPFAMRGEAMRART